MTACTDSVTCASPGSVCGEASATCGRDPAPRPWILRAWSHLARNRHYLTPAKLINIALVNIQFALKTERVLGRPYKMKIESTNICNTHCQLCPTGIGLQGRPKGKMSYENFTALIDRFQGHLVALDLSMWGDPLIVPDIYRMIRYAHQRGIWTYISSNLHAFKPDAVREDGKTQAELLVESGLDLMTCSLHGATQQTYEMYQPGKRFDEAVEKIRRIIDTRDRLGSSSPQLQLNFVVMKQNEHEIEAFRKLAASLGCKPIFSMPSANVRFAAKDKNLISLGLADDVVEQKQKDMLNRWLPSDPNYRLSSYDQMLEGTYRSARYNGYKEHFCDWLWRQIVINWDGNVSTCCGSFEPGEDMGNVFQQSLGRIWNGKKYRMARRSFRRTLTDEQAENNGCATCPGFMV
ncbi:MAG: SPASM domain-containing protein [Phycisphaeraceae bacterium]|nr:SPASM domain-containing protein [Phycisphaeraceae bacterium]